MKQSFEYLHEIHVSSSDGALFGSSIALLEDFLVVGSIGDGMDSRKHTGSAYVFEYDKKRSRWSVQQLLHPSSISSYDQFGCSVGIAKNSVAVGSLNGKVLSGDFSVNSGVVNIWTLTGSHWTHSAVLVPQPVEAYTEFGASIQLYHDILLVSAVGDNTQCIGCGAVYLFKRSRSDVWSKMTKLTVSNTSTRFGENIALYNDNIVVSAQHDTSDYVVYAYQYSGGTWTSRGELFIASHPTSLALLQSTLFVGMSEMNGCGAVYVYQLHSGVWSYTNSLKPITCTQQLHFGDAISTADNTTLIGAYGYKNVTTNRITGAVYTYILRNEKWSQHQMLMEGRLSNDNYGRALAIYESTLAVAASGDDTIASNAGGIFMYSEAGMDEEALSGANGDTSIPAVVGGAAIILFFLLCWYVRGRFRRKNGAPFDKLVDNSGSKSGPVDDGAADVEMAGTY